MNNKGFQIGQIALFTLLISGCIARENAHFNATEAAKARVELAMGYLQSGNFIQAKRNLDKALTHDKNYYLSYLVLARLNQLQNDQTHAQSAYLTALKLAPKQGDVHNNYATFLCSQGKYPQAFAHFDEALNAPHYYQQNDTLENIYLCANQAKEQNRANQALEKLRARDSQRAEKLSKNK